MRPIDRNPALLCAFHGLQMSLFPMAIISVFWKMEIGLSMFQIYLVQGFFGLAMVVFEFPSGYLADRIGYRASLRIASLLMIGGWAVYLQAESLIGVVMAELVLGVGMALISGCDTALLYESLAQRGKETDFARWSGRMGFWGQAAEGTAALAAGALYVVSPRLPFLVQLPIWGVAAVLAWRMVEPHRDRPPAADNWRQIRAMVRHVALENAALRAVLVLTVLLSLSSFIPVWLIQIYATDAGVGQALLGPIWAAANYSVAVGSLLSVRLEHRLGLRRTLLFCVVCVAVGYCGLGLSHAVWGFAFYFFLTLQRGIFHPVLHHQEQRLIPSRDRAGFVSLRSLVFRATFFVLGPLLGAAIDRVEMHPVLLALGVGLTLSLAFAWRSLRRRLPGGAQGAAVGS